MILDWQLSSIILNKKRLKLHKKTASNTTNLRVGLLVSTTCAVVTTSIAQVSIAHFIFQISMYKLKRIPLLMKYFFSKELNLLQKKSLINIWIWRLMEEKISINNNYHPSTTLGC